MGQMGQMGCPIDCARALEDRGMPCRIGRAVGTILGAVKGRHSGLARGSLVERVTIG